MSEKSETSELLSTRHDSGVLELVLNRPAKKNALTLAMYAGLVEALEAAADDDQIQAVLLRGEGDSFSAGNDIADFATAAQQPDNLKIIVRFLHCIAEFPKPLMAAVQGDAVGIGTTMLLHCDLVVAAEPLRCQTPFVKLGLVPEGGSSLLLPQRIGQRHAFELLVEGRPFDAERAQEIGLVNQVVAPDQLRQAALERAGQVAALPAEAVRLSKQLLKKEQQSQLSRVLDEEATLFGQRLLSAEARQAFLSFMQKP
ncbi:enoyl-CoA hydratase [Marinobacterium arenosum]|uniref:enoyl-CoA hydratase n=1 Tax=Marinobacterium arenosum TaxID=2862496 RepID=UPI001C975558|nr:enoyl-CoA hydratase [Marinobacterium arenosum]MBY4677771.1 enoyl-CoA hydratase [Marinobacterium arenosum]